MGCGRETPSRPARRKIDHDTWYFLIELVEAIRLGFRHPILDLRRRDLVEAALPDRRVERLVQVRRVQRTAGDFGTPVREPLSLDVLAEGNLPEARHSCQVG